MIREVPDEGEGGEAEGAVVRSVRSEKLDDRREGLHGEGGEKGGYWRREREGE